MNCSKLFFVLLLLFFLFCLAWLRWLNMMEIIFIFIWSIDTNQKNEIKNWGIYFLDNNVQYSGARCISTLPRESLQMLLNKCHKINMLTLMTDYFFFFLLFLFCACVFVFVFVILHCIFSSFRSNEL